MPGGQGLTGTGPGLWAIVKDGGTGAYEGVSGRLFFKDDVEAGNFPYRGHLRW